MFLIRFIVGSIARFFSILFWLLMLVVFALTAAAYFPEYEGRYQWQFDLISQFRLQYLWILLAAFALLALYLWVLAGLARDAGRTAPAQRRPAGRSGAARLRGVGRCRTARCPTWRAT